MKIDKYYSEDQIEWSISDFRSGTVSLTKDQLAGHIAIEHPEMITKMDAIKDTIADPDDVYYDISEHAETYAFDFYKTTPLLGTEKFRVQASVAYTDGTFMEGYLKTVHKVSQQRRGKEKDELRVYHKEK